MTLLNVTAYRFVTLNDVETLAAELQSVADRLELRGSVILAQEGINLYVAGEPARVHEFLAHLDLDDRFRDLDAKESSSDDFPFRRMKVLVRREIVTMGLPDRGLDDVDTAREAAPHLTPDELRQWLDEERPIRLLDTRNAHEYERGTFRGAEHLDLARFRDFPEAADRLEPTDTPLVTFCTGGIRCEKATAYLRRCGFENVYQLEGGILRYLEKHAGAHWEGECFVFDDRVAVDRQLRPVSTD